MNRFSAAPGTRLLAVLLAAGCATAPAPAPEGPGEIEGIPEAPREFRAAWIATVSNIDWPSAPGLPVERQKAELRALLDRAAALNLNAVILQVRPAADALYHSELEPWSEYLTGVMGEPPDPFYDPLEFAITGAHERGLELHAWFNPYRAHHPSASSDISPDHISRTHPELVRDYGTHLWLDPGAPEAHEHTLRVILDVVERYDIDGVHFDDYFYPYDAYADGADFPDSASWARAVEAGVRLSRDDWRRRNVDRLIEELYHGIKRIKPHVKFGISPFGIWRPGHPEGTIGFDAYAELYADARKWLREGWVDYFTPQIYYRMDQVAQPFPVMLQWWAEQNAKGRHLWPGHFTGRVDSEGDRKWSVREITGQVFVTRAHPGVTGNVHFPMSALLKSPDRLAEHLAAGAYARPALVPASPWLGDDPPGRPEIALREHPDGVAVAMTPSGEEPVRWWVVRTRHEDGWRLDVVPGAERRYELGDRATGADAVVVSAVDRLGNEGPLSERVERDDRRPPPRELADLKPPTIARSAWEAHPSGGHEADAVRRNLGVGDDVDFGDLNVGLVGMHPGAREDTVAVDTASVLLRNGEVREERRVPEGTAFNWRGYHIGILAVNTREDELGSGLVELEAATVASLPVDRAAELKTGDAAQRLRVRHDVHSITLHHSGSPEPLTPDEDPVERIRGLQTWGERARGWWDVPYHFLIDLDGRIYEGRDVRYAGETNTTYDPRGHLLIAVLGNYDEQEPTPAQIEAIGDLMGWAATAYGVPGDRIYGHGDWADTSCPGRHLQEYFDDGTFLRAAEQVRDRAEGAGPFP